LYLYALMVAAIVPAICLLIAWVAWLIFNFVVFTKADRNTKVFKGTAKVAKSFGRAKVRQASKMPALRPLRGAEQQPPQNAEPPTAV
jgi:hypothetical protein